MAHENLQLTYYLFASWIKRKSSDKSPKFILFNYDHFHNYFCILPYTSSKFQHNYIIHTCLHKWNPIYHTKSISYVQLLASIKVYIDIIYNKHNSTLFLFLLITWSLIATNRLVVVTSYKNIVKYYLCSYIVCYLKF